jgi:hypothetical protein
MKMKRNMISFSFFQVMEWKHRWNEIDRGKPKYSGEKPVPVPLCPPQIPNGHRGSNPGLRGEKPAPNRLSHGTAVGWFTWRIVWPLCRHLSFNTSCLNTPVSLQPFTNYSNVYCMQQEQHSVLNESNDNGLSCLNNVALYWLEVALFTFNRILT